jgi:hypothetical protein
MNPQLHGQISESTTSANITDYFSFGNSLHNPYSVYQIVGGFQGCFSIEDFAYSYLIL